MPHRYRDARAEPGVEAYGGKWYPLVKYVHDGEIVGSRAFPDQACMTQDQAHERAVGLAAALNRDPRELPGFF
jgi:hypothetical protein